jgi:hypothetical protein
MVKAGERAAAENAFMSWIKPREIIVRRTKERDLFFSGKWSSNGTTIVWPVRKPSYRPNWSNADQMNVTEPMRRALA